MENNEKKQFQCSGDCLTCRLNPVERRTQWQYCSSQFTYNTMRMIEAMQETLETMADEFEELKQKVAAIQDNEALVFNPSIEDEEIAQEGDGAAE